MTPHHDDKHLCTSKIRLFSGLPQDKQHMIVSRAKRFDVLKDEVILRQGDPADFLLIIRSGKVKVNQYDYDGKEQILSIRQPGAIVGEEYFLESERFGYNVMSLEPTGLCKISKRLIIELMQEDADFAQALLSALTTRMQEANEQIALLMEDDALKRLSLFLLREVERTGSREIRLSIDHLAGSTNLRRETVSRKLSHLIELGLIVRSGNKKLSVPSEKNLSEYLLEN